MIGALTKNSRPSSQAGAQNTDPIAGKYLGFRVAKHEFAIKALSVREIMGMQPITAVPQAPTYLKGIMNLRGKSIPVVDLRLKFGWEEAAYTHRTCIIVVQLEIESGDLPIGAIVDGLSEVTALQPSDIERTPAGAPGPASPYSVGTARLKGKVKTLLDVNLLFTSQEVRAMDSTTH